MCAYCCAVLRVAAYWLRVAAYYCVLVRTCHAARGSEFFLQSRAQKVLILLSLLPPTFTMSEAPAYPFPFLSPLLPRILSFSPSNFPLYSPISSHSFLILPHSTYKYTYPKIKYPSSFSSHNSVLISSNPPLTTPHSPSFSFPFSYHSTPFPVIQ